MSMSPLGMNRPSAFLDLRTSPEVAYLLGCDLFMVTQFMKQIVLTITSEVNTRSHT